MPPTTLSEWVAAQAHTPRAIVTINGTVIQQFVSVDVTMGVEQQSSTASLRLAADDYPPWGAHTNVTIKMGYGGIGGGVRTVFVGEIEDIDTKYLPYFIEIKAAGFLKRTQHPAGNTDPLSGSTDPILTWSGATDSQIWNDLMKLAGVPLYVSGEGDSRTIAGPILLNPGDNLRGLIDNLDHASESGQMTFEFAGNVYRQAALRVPSLVPTYRYTEGAPTGAQLPVYSLDRQQTDRDLKNQVIITGVQAAGEETAAVVGAVRQQASIYWGKDGFGDDIYVPFTLQSDLLETRDQCDAVAQRYMYEHNKITDIVQMRTPLNPYAMPSRTVGLTSGRMGLDTETNYWVRQIHHHWGADGASTDWTLEGGAGDSGYLVGLPPTPIFTLTATKETFEVGGIPTTYYTVVADGSMSSDPDGNIATWAWENNKNGDTGDGPIYTTSFTNAEWDDETTPTITLTITDDDLPDAHTGTTGEVDVLSALMEDEAKLLAMYVAAFGVAEATSDGWETVNSWTPPANALSCCRIAAEGTNYFGLANGHIYVTTDYLASEPTDVGWTAPGGSAVNALWMNELDSNLIGIGLANGSFYITVDAFTTAPVLKRNFVNPIQWIEGSRENPQQWRVAVGQDVWYTNHDFLLGDVRVLVAFAGLTTKQTELTAYANYASALGAAGSVILKREDGVAIAFPSLSPAPAEAHMTAFIETDELLVGDDQGRSFISLPASAATTLVQMADIGFGSVHDMLRDNTNYACAYAACDTGLVKTFDKAATWVRVRPYDGSATKALQIGYDSAPLVPLPILADQLIERTYYPNKVGAFWDHPPGDDPDVNVIAMDLWNPLLPPGPDGSRNDEPPTDWYKLSYTPAAHSPAGTTHQWKTGRDGVTNTPMGGQVQAYDRAARAWVRSDTTGTGVPSGWPGSPGPGNYPAMVMRHKFTLPDIVFNTVMLSINVALNNAMDEPNFELYVNDTLVTTAIGSQYISAALFTADDVTENLVALRMTLGPGVYASLAYKFSFGTDTASVSLYEDTTNTKLVWASTAEGSCISDDHVTAGWSDLYMGSLATPGDAKSGVSQPGLYLGIYAPPWPAADSNPGRKLANMNGSFVTGPGLLPYPIFFHSQSIDMPAGADTAWSLYIRKHLYETIIDDIYLNGTRLATGTPASPASDAGANLFDSDHRIYKYTIPSGDITMGGRNTLAIQCHGPTINAKFSALAWYMIQD